MSSEVVHKGWMVRYGWRMIGQYIHMRYFVLNSSRLLAYYEKKPQENQEPIKAMLIDGNCIVEDQGLKTHQGHMVYVLSVYNKKEKYQPIRMAAFNIQEALNWKEKIELVIDQAPIHIYSLCIANSDRSCTTQSLIDFVTLMIRQDSDPPSLSGNRMSFASDRFSVFSDDIED